jgi:putative ABC transport system substrate-binding protein
VETSDATTPHQEFVHELRQTMDPDAALKWIRLPAQGAGAKTDDDAVRGDPARAAAASAAAPDPAGITIAVGLKAASSAMERPGQGPLVLAMLSRLDYESLKGSGVLRHPERPVGVLLRDPAMADQVALIDAILPRKHRLGVIATAESEPIVHELQRAAPDWDLQIEYATDAKSLASVLRMLVARSDALLVLPDMIGNDQAATLAVLRAGASAGLPVFGSSDGLVRSGGLAAAVSTPDQLALQAGELARKLAAGDSASNVLVEAATPATVRVNATVARALGLRLPDERELTAKVTALR